MLACKNSGFVVRDHFAEVSKTIKMPNEREELKKLRISKTKLMLDE